MWLWCNWIGSQAWFWLQPGLSVTACKTVPAHGQYTSADRKRKIRQQKKIIKHNKDKKLVWPCVTNGSRLKHRAMYCIVDGRQKRDSRRDGSITSWHRRFQRNADRRQRSTWIQSETEVDEDILTSSSANSWRREENQRWETNCTAAENLTFLLW